MLILFAIIVCLLLSFPHKSACSMDVPAYFPQTSIPIGWIMKWCGIRFGLQVTGSTMTVDHLPPRHLVVVWNKSKRAKTANEHRLTEQLCWLIPFSVHVTANDSMWCKGGTWPTDEWGHRPIDGPASIAFHNPSSCSWGVGCCFRALTHQSCAHLDCVQIIILFSNSAVMQYRSLIH